MALGNETRYSLKLFNHYGKYYFWGHFCPNVVSVQTIWWNKTFTEIRIKQQIKHWFGWIFFFLTSLLQKQTAFVGIQMYNLGLKSMKLVLIYTLLVVFLWKFKLVFIFSAIFYSILFYRTHCNTRLSGGYWSRVDLNMCACVLWQLGVFDM